MTTDDDSQIDDLSNALILAYQTNLLKGITQSTLEAAISASEDLNAARVKAGLDKMQFTKKELSVQALTQVEDYYTNLVKKGGSDIVENDKLVFKPWLSDLKTALKEQMSFISSMPYDLQSDAIQTLKTQGYIRADLAAEHEILRNEYKIINSIWKYGGVTSLVWRSLDDPTTCSVCAHRDKDIFTMNDSPELPSHPGCRCRLDIYKVE